MYSGGETRAEGGRRDALAAETGRVVFGRSFLKLGQAACGGGRRFCRHLPSWPLPTFITFSWD